VPERCTFQAVPAAPARGKAGLSRRGGDGRSIRDQPSISFRVKPRHNSHFARPEPEWDACKEGVIQPRLTANRKQQKALLSLLCELRVQAGIRQVDMARALGKPQAFVSYYESGARRLDLLELRQVCKVLGISLPDFVRTFEKRLL